MNEEIDKAPYIINQIEKVIEVNFLLPKYKIAVIKEIINDWRNEE